MRFEILRQELANGAQVIPALLAGLTPAEARFKPNPETWSVLEVVCHLYDEEREDFRQRLDIMLHRPADPWPPIDPPGWVTVRAYNERDYAQMLDQWQAERAHSVAWLDGLAAPDWDAWVTSPFGSMRPGDMLAAWVAHDNLHQRQLVELRRSRLLNLVEPYDVQYAGDW
jgi:DinB superfamily